MLSLGESTKALFFYPLHTGANMVPLKSHSSRGPCGCQERDTDYGVEKRLVKRKHIKRLGDKSGDGTFIANTKA